VNASRQFLRFAVFLFSAATATADINGRVTTAAGNPAVGAIVALEEGKVSTRAKADGSFTLPARGSVRDVLTITRDGSLDHRQVIAQADATVGVTLVESAGSVTDIDGNTYQSVRIGKQVWTASNLRVKRFNDGAPIPFQADTAGWKDNTAPLWCNPKDTTDPQVIRRFGLLYNFHAVDTKKLAPPGWHVPTAKEWVEFEAYLIAHGGNWDGSKAGDKIAKAISAKTDWNASEVEGAIGNDLGRNNATGFSAFGTGFRHESGIYEAPGRNTGWWTSTPASSDHAGMIDLHFNQGDWSNAHHYRSACGYPVRLVKD
jgi:uncharacterized protein (TIGR02145 family)